MGILYLLRFPNNKYYVGQTVGTMNQRLIKHKSKAKKNPKNGCVALNNAINKYGYENIVATQLNEVADDDLDLYETYYIKVFNSLAPYGYNLQTGGSVLKRHSNITKKKMSKSAKARNSTFYRKSEKTKKLPKYVGYVKNKYQHGYKISKHPNCSSKYFTDKNKTLKQNLADALKFIKQLNSGKIKVKHERVLPEGIQKMGNGYRVYAMDPITKKRVIKNYANTSISKKLRLKQAIKFVKDNGLVLRL